MQYACAKLTFFAKCDGEVLIETCKKKMMLFEVLIAPELCELVGMLSTLTLTPQLGSSIIFLDENL